MQNGLRGSWLKETSNSIKLQVSDSILAITGTATISTEQYGRDLTSKCAHMAAGASQRHKCGCNQFPDLNDLIICKSLFH